MSCIKTFAKKFNSEIGFSDHTIGNFASILAMGLGATIFEKHITLDNKLSGPDHNSSMNPAEFEKYVKTLVECDKAIGDGKKKITDEEKMIVNLIRKSIYAKENIKKNEIFSNKNLITLRPEKGISAKYFFKFLKKRSKKKYAKFQLINY